MVDGGGSTRRRGTLGGSPLIHAKHCKPRVGKLEGEWSRGTKEKSGAGLWKKGQWRSPGFRDGRREKRVPPCGRNEVWRVRMTVWSRNDDVRVAMASGWDRSNWVTKVSCRGSVQGTGRDLKNGPVVIVAQIGVGVGVGMKD